MTIKEFKIQYALGTLSTDDLKELANNPGTSKGILRKLAKMYHLGNHQINGVVAWIVRCSLAENPNTPIEILEKLSKEPGHYIRENVKNNPSMKGNSNDH